MQQSIFISIVTINYKQSEMTNELLKSLQLVSNVDFEVIIVDNNSGEEELEKLNLDFPNVKLIKSIRNLGFSGGNNLGINQAKGKYILLLNNDTLVDPTFLKPMVDLLEADDKIGAVSPLIQYTERPGIIQYAGFTKMNPLTLRMKGIGQYQKNEGQHIKPQETPFAHGCAMMIPKRVINQVGLMEEAYFLYYEEHDWSERIRRAGFKIMFQPQSCVFHKESVSTGKDSPLKTYFLNRNRILFMRRHFKWYIKVLTFLYLLCISIPANTIRFIIKNNYKHLSAYYDALIWHITLKNKEKWIIS
nr:glycosyltransferase family 2 protein [uncultured Carboxylicivirga sp.]